MQEKRDSLTECHIKADVTNPIVLVQRLYSFERLVLNHELIFFILKKLFNNKNENSLNN